MKAGTQMKKLIFATLVAALFTLAESSETCIGNRLQKVEIFSQDSGMNLVDCVYVINFEAHLEKWVYVRNALEAYSIHPNRVDAAGGHFFNKKEQRVGCLLNYLSAIKDAYERGYEIVWICGDEIEVFKNPHRISVFISHLSKIDANWDIFYTDPESQIEAASAFCLSFQDLPHCIEKEAVSSDILKVNQRSGIYSMIISKRGMEKLLDHFGNKSLQEVCKESVHHIAGISQYCSIEQLASLKYTSVSDVKLEISQEKNWKNFQNETLLKMSDIPGWCSKEKALIMMNLIKENRFQTCLEIGVFSGMSLFPIAKTLKYNRNGIVYAIDSWSSFEATQGLRKTDPNYIWWSQLNFDEFYNYTVDLVRHSGLNGYCRVIKNSAKDAACLFLDDTIDFIHFDGSHDGQCAFQDIEAYFPKVKDGGYIMLNDANWLCMRQALVYLLERADLVFPFSPSTTYLLFRKNNLLASQAAALLKGDI